MPSSHRHLVHRHVRRLLNKNPTIPDATKDFNIIASRFNLPPSVIDSVYPRQDSSAPVTVLPHIVFKDPHLPWNHEPTFVDREAEKKDLPNNTPWLLLLTFSEEELKLDDGTLEDIVDGLVGVKAEQSETMAVRMRVNQTQSLKKVVNAIPYDPEKDEHDAEAPADIIFVNKYLFMSLFTDPVAKNNKLDVSQYKYMAHVRQADKENDDPALSSIVVSPRTGPLDSTVPTTNIVHLVSLNTKSSEEMQAELASDKDRVALVSLHSWSYTCIPSEGDAIPSARLDHLGNNLTVIHSLKPTEPEENPPGDEDPDRMQKLITKRQEDGYTITPYRTVTGERTSALIRGPFSPKFVPHPLVENFSIQSNTGADLQILDPVLGLMDITYDSAWQLGRKLAMKDVAFCAALARLRKVIHGKSLGSSKIDVHSPLGSHRSRLDTLGSMRDPVQGLNALNEGLHQDGDVANTVASNRNDTSSAIFTSNDGDSHRISHRINKSMHSPHISTLTVDQADATALSQAMGTDGGLYNEHKTPNNVDFALVYSWVLDKLHLGDVPAHYLIPDPSFLPQETLRFFHLDENWTDALVDGTLSLANHWASSPEQDLCRTAIKKAIQKRLDEPDPSLRGWRVQMPRYGFILRSQLLVEFPSIAVNVEYVETRIKAGQAPKAPILVQKTLSDGTMYCLVDCAPPDLKSITFTTSLHQQRFTVGSNITPKDLTVSFKKIYTEPDPNAGFDKDSKTPMKEHVYPMDAGEIFDIKSRTIKTKSYTEAVLATLQSRLTPDKLSDISPSSTLLALQLREPIFEVVTTLPQGSRAPRNPTPIPPLPPHPHPTPPSILLSPLPPRMTPMSPMVRQAGLERRQNKEKQLR